MIAPELLAILVCPETHQEVELASAPEVERLVEAARAGEVLTVAGKPANAALEGALIRQDRAVAYPIRDGIPVMLVSEGLAIGQLDLRACAVLRTAA